MRETCSRGITTSGFLPSASVYASVSSKLSIALLPTSRRTVATPRQSHLVRQSKIDLGPFALVGSAPPVEGVAAGYAPRRTILDKILVDAAAAAGAEVQERFSVEEILMDVDCITGIRGHAAGGATVTEHARIVVGADGMHSHVARRQTDRAISWLRRPAELLSEAVRARLGARRRCRLP